ncbi:ABC transporter [Microbacterium sp. Marseille-Q6965]|uniref:ABC transporter n=1 Tax=Microbacterium sp. Marseille-Q6965 TaxID=2965072 RepID=UPI0021B76BE3|nr:ABC transporter [Microbacterium sp. Marseille-Q6965]
MSDAQGEKNTPTTGEPIEERAAETPADARPVEAPADERPSALSDAIGEDPDIDGEATRAPVTAEGAAPQADAERAETPTEAAPAPAATTAAESAPVDTAAEPARADVAADAAATDEPATRAAARRSAPEDQTEPADDAPAAEPAPAAKPEPDYAALAAELDALEARHGAADGAAPAEPREPSTGASGSPWFERADETQTFRATEPEVSPAVTASEPAAETTAAPAPAPQPVFVEAPEPPTKRGNRGAAGLIGLVAAVAFALLFFAAVAGYVALTDGFASVDELTTFAIETATSVTFWIPVVAFFLAFWLLGAIVNRARWAAWVLLGFFVAVIVYVAQVLAPVIAGPFWMVTPGEAADLIREGALTPLSVAAFVIAREVTIWFGAWAARRGAKMNRLNAEAQEEYERTLEAGPSA